MAEPRAVDGENIFVYMGGEQVVPRDVTHVIVDESVKIIRQRAFRDRRRLASIEMHDEIETIEEEAFFGCISLKGSMRLPGVRVVGRWAFARTDLTAVDFGDKLETIGHSAFYYCRSLRSVKMPTVRIIYECAFENCDQLTDVEMPEVERIGHGAFSYCPLLRRIAIPLKDDIFQGYRVFNMCENLSTVDVVGGIHKTISSLHMESWRNEMNAEIDRINSDLEDTPTNEKTRAIQQWIRSVLQRIEHYKTEHYMLLKKSMTLLELALWKAKLLDENEEGHINDEAARRKARRITSGASDVINNVLPFLALA
jgi:hypothetical protein